MILTEIFSKIIFLFGLLILSFIIQESPFWDSVDLQTKRKISGVTPVFPTVSEDVALIMSPVFHA